MVKVLIEKLVHMIEETISNVKDITVNASLIWYFFEKMLDTLEEQKVLEVCSKHCKIYACFRFF